MALKVYYQKDSVTLYHGRAEDIDPIATEGIDLLLGDPPYGINYKSNHNSSRHKPGREMWDKYIRRDNFQKIKGDDKPFDPAPWLGRHKKVALFGGNFFASRLPDAKCWIVWDKRVDTTPDRQADAELIWTNFKKPTRIYRHLWRGIVRAGEENVSRQPKYHPNQKPVALLTWIMQYAEAESVVDYWVGSGSTLVAAYRLGIPAIGVETEEQYCETAAMRLEKEVVKAAA